jgi:hypothetical protein
MLILSLGVPRSGTILVFNVLREVLTRRGVPFRQVNTNYPETEAFLKDYDFADNVLMHAHNVLPQVQRVLPDQRTIAFFNYRDPRDMVVSMMKLHDYDFDKCLELAEISYRQLDIARKYPKIMLIPYEHLMAALEAFIFQVAMKLKILLPLDQVAEIRKLTDLDAHKKIMKDVGREKVPVQVRRNPKRVLRESTTHFINDRHIQSGKCARWRDELTDGQKKIAGARFARLIETLGYPRE